MILFLLSILAGILTVFAPCTISLLPVIVGGSLEGQRSVRRALVVTVSLGVSVILFTLLLKVSTAFINVPQSFWEILSGVIIIVIGFTMVFPSLYDRLGFVNRLSRSSNKLMSEGYMKQSIWGDVIVGAALGPVFSSCSPTYFLIIATVLPASFVTGSVYLLAYTVGLCATLLLVAVAGQKLLDKFGVASDPSGWLKRGIGILFIIVGLAIALGLDARIELAFANSGIFGTGGLEQAFLSAAHPSGTVAGTPAPEITDPAGFINTGGQPITIAGEKGKVVLIDFWDYSCINCEREIPYVEAWYQKYAASGLVVIGVHTPEFSFEKLMSNVQAAVTSLGITYPVVLDNDYGTWNAFDNEYWPQTYLINSQGDIVYSHSGEGDYPETEAAIQAALSQIDATSTIPTGTVAPLGAVQVDGSQLGSPETYFGYERNQYLANGEPSAPGTQTLTLPSSPQLDGLYLGGTWNFQGEYAEAKAPATVEYEFDAKDVYMVATGNPTAVYRVLLDGSPIPAADMGADVASDGTVTVQADKLYKLVNLPSYGTHTLELQIESGTLDAYTFTFG
jgi:cytochrome c biogenesis protein CcdA/thiol-disulfide isomerase/thioredoxin